MYVFGLNSFVVDISSRNLKSVPNLSHGKPFCLPLILLELFGRTFSLISGMRKVIKVAFQTSFTIFGIPFPSQCL